MAVITLMGEDSQFVAPSLRRKVGMWLCSWEGGRGLPWKWREMEMMEMETEMETEMEMEMEMEQAEVTVTNGNVSDL